MKDVYFITKFTGECEHFVGQPRCIDFSESYETNNWLEDGFTVGTYATEYEALKAFRPLSASVYLTQGYPRGWLLQHESYALEVAHIPDEEWDDDESLEANACNATDYDIIDTKVQPCFIDADGRLHEGYPYSMLHRDFNGRLFTAAVESEDHEIHVFEVDLSGLLCDPGDTDDIVQHCFEKLFDSDAVACCTEQLMSDLTWELSDAIDNCFDIHGYQRDDEDTWRKAAD